MDIGGELHFCEGLLRRSLSEVETRDFLAKIAVFKAKKRENRFTGALPPLHRPLGAAAPKCWCNMWPFQPLNVGTCWMLFALLKCCFNMWNICGDPFYSSRDTYAVLYGCTYSTLHIGLIA